MQRYIIKHKHNVVLLWILCAKVIRAVLTKGHGLYMLGSGSGTIRCGLVGVGVALLE